MATKAHPVSCALPSEAGLDPATLEFYRRAMAALLAAQVPFLVGGAYAFGRYTGIVRHTRDFDVFIERRDLERTLAAMSAAGWEVERCFPHWLAKVRQGSDYVDVIYSSGNGIARVDAAWFEHAVEERVLGTAIRLSPAEEMIWSKAFIMERERFDGADILHLLRCRAADLDWDRLLARFGVHWRVLLSHLVLFGFVYPDAAADVPARVLEDLLARLHAEIGLAVPPAGLADDAGDGTFCRGTLLSRSQYLVDVEEWGYRDARLRPFGEMTERELAIWTGAAHEEEASREGR